MSGGTRSRALLISSLVLAVAPKCPACLLAYAGLVGSASLSWSVYGAYSQWLAVATAVSLALTVGAVAFQGRCRHETAPALIALLASAAILAGRFWLHQKPFIYLGMAALLGAAVRASRPAGCSSCSATRSGEDHMERSNRWRFTALLAVLMIAGVIAGTAGLRAQQPPPPKGPCPFAAIDIDKYGRQPFQNPPDKRAHDGWLETTLSVEYTNPKAVSLGGCPVTLRSYNGQLVGPTLRIRPGETLAPTLKNALPLESPDEAASQIAQEATNAFIDTMPHSFNTTNLHTHGLHVSPTGNSDNVLLAIPPQTSFPYEIHVPSNHPRGTFWYHAHTHGSTAIQVGSGMSGALIIEDDPEEIPEALRKANEREKVMVFQTILYDTYGRADDITAFFPDSKSTEVLCKEGKSGCTWQNSLRRVTINGQIVPTIKMRPGEIQRWRMIDTSFRESLSIHLESHSLHEIALDGIYLGRIDTWGPAQTVQLQPGYRSDVLVQASMKPGTYRLIDAPTSAIQALRGVEEDENLLAEIVVEGDPVDMKLPTDAEMAKLAPFPGVNLQAQADGVQTAVFKLGSSANPTNDPRNYFQINYAAFNPTRIRYVKLGATDMLNLTTVGDPSVITNGIPPLPHVFHIHVNPFQTTRTDPEGSSETVWKDTLLIPAGQTLNIYTQYTDYIGQFVMHCHILDHEDLGMMEIVEVVGEDTGTPTMTHSGHSH
jgi:FtsP/CotA-like multicopper oxidase with cupredoxin domain